MVQSGFSSHSLLDTKLSTLLADATIESDSVGSGRVPGPPSLQASESTGVDGEWRKILML